MDAVNEKKTKLPTTIKATLNEEQIRGMSPPDNANGQRRIKEHSAAVEALERVNADQLFVLYEQAVRERGEIEVSLIRVLGIKSGDKPLPLRNSEDVILSMEHVALAAIDLAKSIATKMETKKP